MSNELTILIGMLNRADIRVVSRLLEQYGLPYRVCPDSGEFCAEAAEGGSVLLLEEEMLNGEVIAKIKNLLDNQPMWSEVPVILLVKSNYGRSARGKSLLDRIPSLTIIERPVSSASLISVLRSAQEARLRQYQVRDLLGDLRRSNRELEKRLRQSAVTRFTDIMLVYLDPDFNFVWVNSPYAENMGMEPEELVGKNHFDLYPDPDNEAIFKKVRDSGEPVFYKDYPFEFPDRPERGVTYWDWSLSPEKDEKGNVEGLVLSLRETTRYKRAQLALEERLARYRQELEETVERRTRELEETHKKLLHAEKLSAVGRFSASIAHEINNPLFGIRNVIADLKQNEALSEEEVELAGMALEECDRIKRLIKDLQDFNRPSTGVVAPLDIHETIDSVLSLTKKEVQNKNIRVVKEYAADMVEIVGVKDQIKQVILNLIKNGIDAIPDSGGWIEVFTEVLFGKVIVIQIMDSGKGIGPEEAKQIFEPFFSTKPAVKGTGLGLSVCYGIVTRHGGNIFFNSEPGSGSTFTVILPIGGPPNE